jgi:cytochrome c
MAQAFRNPFSIKAKYMKKITLFLMMAWASGQALAAPTLSAKEAAAAAELAKNNGCLSCHALDEKIVGPAYSKVAAKYSDDKDAPVSLAQSIRNGSQGKWGRIPMPSHGNMSNEDILLLARWVMSTHK